MDITPLIPAETQIIQSYGLGQFRINGRVYDHPVIVMPIAVQSWTVGDRAALSENDFNALLDMARDLDVILIGGGAKAMRPDADIRRALKAKGLNLEFMDTGAACRTYNVLMAEGRRVGAALLPL